MVNSLLWSTEAGRNAVIGVRVRSISFQGLPRMPRYLASSGVNSEVRRSQQVTLSMFYKLVIRTKRQAKPTHKKKKKKKKKKQKTISIAVSKVRTCADIPSV